MLPIFSRALQLLALAAAAVKAWPSQSFKTEPFTPPVFNTSKSGGTLAPGLIFFTPLSPDQTAAMIISDDGDLVWSSPTGIFDNLLVQNLDSMPVLTYWSGVGSAQVLAAGHGAGSITILDSTYTVLYNICPDLGLVFLNGTTNECQADIHESYITSKGSLLVTAYNLTQADLTSVGGAADGWVFDSMFFEIDIKTQDILFSWSALATYLSVIPSWLSMVQEPLLDPTIGFTSIPHNRWARDGMIEWEFEGLNGGDFSLPANGNFAWEHDARVQNSTPGCFFLSLFDNANSSPPLNGTNQTRGLEFSLDVTNKKATLVKNLSDPRDPLYVDSQGTFSILSNGNEFMGYGQLPKIKEYGPTGDVRMSIQWQDMDAAASYRTFRSPWTATPASNPAALAVNSTVFMSWNGATQVTNWVVYEGKTSTSLTKTKKISNTGFESSTSISNSTVFVQVAAFSDSQFLRNSSQVQVT